MMPTVYRIVCRFALTFSVFLHHIGFSKAQTSQNGDSAYSLEQCLQLARQNNLDFQQALIRQQIAGNNVKMAANNYLPSVNAYGRRVYNWGLFIDPATNILSNFSSQVYTGSVNADLDLFNGGLYHYTLQQNKALNTAAGYDAQAVIYNISLGIVQNYYQALLASELTLLAEKQLTQTKKLLSIIRKQADAGIITVREILSMESQLTQKELDLTKAKITEQQTLNNLKLAMNIPATQNITLQRPDLTTLSTLSGIAVDSLNGNMPQIKSLEYNIIAADHAIRVAQSGKYPVFSLSAGLASRSSNLIQLEVGQQFSNNLSKTVTFSLRVPLFNKFQYDIAARNAELNKQMLGMQLKSFTMQQTNRLKNLELDLKADAQNLVNLQKQLQYLEKELSFAEKSFQMGSMTYYDYSQVQLRQQSTLIDQARARIDLIYKLRLFDTYKGN